MSKGQFMDIVKDKETMKGIYTVKMTSHHHQNRNAMGYLPSFIRFHRVLNT